ncbi:MAG: type II toxin-antitoxin system RelE/ParE family toxin, partial [Dokdonella sp.]
MAAIRGYIAVDNPFYADVFAARLVAASESPDQLAERGRVVPELSRSDVRELLFQHYRIIYRLGAHRVDILALVHG